MSISKALIISAGAGAVSVALALIYMDRFETDASGGTRVEILVANKDVKSGTALTPDMLATRSVPAAYLDDRAVLVRDQSKVIGIEVTTQLKAQESVQWTDLAVRTDSRSVSALVAPGKRAMTIKARGTDNAGNNLMQPGDYIDVFAVVGDSPSNRTSSLLLQRVLVVAVGLDTESRDSKDVKTELNQPNRRDDKLLTLSLDVDEAQLLSLAAEQGRLGVAVRNPTDQRVFDSMPDLNGSALSEARDKVQARKSGAVRAPVASVPTKLTEAQ